MRGVKGTGPHSKYGKGRGKGKKKVDAVTAAVTAPRRIKRRRLKPAEVQPQSEPMFVPNVVVLTPEAVGSMIGVAINTYRSQK